MSDVAVLVPMLGRPHRVGPLVWSIEATTPGATVLFLTSPDDAPVKDAVNAAGYEYLEVARHPHGDYARKIQAGIEATTTPYVFLGADDLRFHPGWFGLALDAMTDGVGVVGTNDLANPRVVAGEHATHFLVARWYVALGTIDEPGVLMHHGYPHEYVDDELVATAKHRGAWAFAAGSIVEHLHPMAGKAPMDDLYAAQPARMRAGRKIYQRRCRLWR